MGRVAALVTSVTSVGFKTFQNILGRFPGVSTPREGLVAALADPAIERHLLERDLPRAREPTTVCIPMPCTNLGRGTMRSVEISVGRSRVPETQRVRPERGK